MTTGQTASLAGIAMTHRAAATCLGRGGAVHAEALRTGRSGLSACDFPGVELECHIGAVAGLAEEAFPAGLEAYDNRAARLALATLRADGLDGAVADAIARRGSGRVGLVIGTSTSGIERLERAYRERQDGPALPADYSLRHHNDHHAVTAFMGRYLGISGPAFTISTACSSSAKAVIDAAQLIALGLCDAVLAGGIDSLCLTSLYGFEALELVSRTPCQPFDVGRRGLSIGEGAGFVLLERGGEGPRLLGYGESSDAVSMSTPPVDGAGAARAMRLALSRAGMEAEEVGFVKLHGTATQSNDAAEGAAVASIFGPAVPAASFKGMIGHTLGAAGAVELLMALDAIDAGIAPGSVGLDTPDPAIPVRVATQSTPNRTGRALCNAFGFGGSNCAVIVGHP